MSRYRGLKNGVNYNRESGYLSKKDLYRILEKYLRHYRRPKYPRPKYRKKSSGRTGRTGRSSGRYRPKQQSTRNPAPKYKKMPKLNLSSPMRETPIRYSHQSHISRTEIDTEQLANAIESKLDGRLTKILLEKLEAEIEELQHKIEPKGINENLETEEETKTQVAEVLKSETEQETIEEQVEYTRETESASKSENETETSQEADNELVETESPEMTENFPDIEDGGSEVITETHEETDHLDSHIIDEEWIDEDGLNTLFWSEIEPDQVEQEAEVNNEPTETETVGDIEPLETELSEAELFPPEVELIEPEPLDEIIELEEAEI